MTPTALIADDEDTSRDQLLQALHASWPKLRVVAQCASGSDAWDLFLEHEPQLCFLDVRMPGLTGIGVAERIGQRAHVVFVIAPGDHALAPFGAGQIDYVIKPIQTEQLDQTVARLKARLQQGSEPQPQLQRLLSQLVKQVRKPNPLEVIQAGVGRDTRLLPVDEVVYFEGDSRYTRAVLHEGEALLRTPLRELVPQLDTGTFRQIARTLIVNQREIAGAARTDDEHMVLTLRGRDERLPVARHFQAQFPAL